jgi:hypothetical protein
VRRHHSGPTRFVKSYPHDALVRRSNCLLFGHDTLCVVLAFVFKSTEVPRLISNVDIASRSNSGLLQHAHNIE